MNQPTLTTTAAPKTARHALHELRRLIASGQLAAGQALIETELAARLAVSRPTLREALRELEAEGLATRSRARGLAVRRLSRRDVVELFDIREALEVLAAAKAAERLRSATASERAVFEVELQLWQSTSASGQLMAFSEANRQLHARVMAAAGNAHLPRLLDHTLIDLFAAQLRGWIAAPLVAQAAGEHVMIINAVMSGDSARAVQAMRDHVRSAASTVLALPDEAF